MNQDLLNETPLSYEEAKELARHNDSNVRKQLAQREDIRPEILFYLAGDPSADVRRAIASNQSTPPQAFVNLARDPDETIRSNLAEKISHLAPRLTASEVDRVQSYAYLALEILASDQLTRVRAVIADALKDVAQAPEDLILKLAHDTELSVCAPVLEHSPVLGDEELLSIIDSGITSGALGAISKRSLVSTSVSDAIVKTNDVSAITSLLSNDSAQIREDTLDELIDQSRNIEEWHSPLVNRPKLHANAVQRLAEFVADNLLNTLKQRDDISPKTLRILRQEVNRRLECSPRPANASEPHLHDPHANNDDLRKEYGWLFQQPPHVIAQNLKKLGRLTSNVITNALNENDVEFVTASLAVQGGVPHQIAQRIMTMQSPRACAALCWKAGVSADIAVRVQAKIAHIPAEEILTSKDGRYALSDEELEWQLDFFNNMTV